MDDWSYALGFMVSDIRFHVSVTRAGSNDIGFRLRKYAWWKTLFKHDRQDLLELIEDELDKFGIPLLETYYEEEDILKFDVLFTKSGVREHLRDKANLDLFLWCRDNPMPKDFDAFVAWAGEFEFHT
tara:strand:+ start:844 stop:1224 length:381 start_codon:yes stop_codon:yes gene_type:complete